MFLNGKLGVLYLRKPPQREIEIKYKFIKKVLKLVAKSENNTIYRGFHY